MIAQTLTIVGLLSALAIAVGLCGVWVQGYRQRQWQDMSAWRQRRPSRHDFDWHLH